MTIENKTCPYCNLELPLATEPTVKQDMIELGVGVTVGGKRVNPQCLNSEPLGEVKKTLSHINVTDETGTRKFVPEPLEKVGEINEGNFEQLWQQVREAKKNNRPSYAKELVKRFIEMIKHQSYEAGRMAGYKQGVEEALKITEFYLDKEKQNMYLSATDSLEKIKNELQQLNKSK